MKKIALLLALAFQLITLSALGDVVVGIHGFLSNSRSMKLTNNALVYSGFEVVLWDFPSRQKYIEEHACDLVALLQHLARKCPERPIHFVSHSIGALILRSALNMPGCPTEAKIGRAVLLAPPNQGSSLARRFAHVFPITLAMGNKSGWEIMHYNPCQIVRYGEFPQTMEVLVIAGTKGNKLWFKVENDGYLTTEETWLNTPFYFLRFPVNHGDLLTTKPVLCSMRDFLKGACMDSVKKL